MATMLQRGMNTTLANGQTATGASAVTAAVPRFAYKNPQLVVSVTGNATGLTLNIEGSLDGANWFTLAQFNACPDMQNILDVSVAFVRANCTAIGSGNFTATVTVE